MHAFTIPSAVKIEAAYDSHSAGYTAEPVVFFLEVALPSDYIEALNAFAALPAGLEFAGRTYGKSAWSSDHNIAIYRSDVSLAQAVGR